MAHTIGSYPRQVRADLRRFYQRDILRCSAPELIALVEDLMSLDSSTARAVNDGPVWQLEHYQNADMWSAFVGKPYPHRPKRTALRREADPKFLRAREDARERARIRNARIASGEIT